MLLEDNPLINNIHSKAQKLAKINQDTILAELSMEQTKIKVVSDT